MYLIITIPDPPVAAVPGTPYPPPAPPPVLVTPLCTGFGWKFPPPPDPPVPHCPPPPPPKYLVLETGPAVP